MVGKKNAYVYSLEEAKEIMLNNEDIFYFGSDIAFKTDNRFVVLNLDDSILGDLALGFPKVNAAQYAYIKYLITFNYFF